MTEAPSREYATVGSVLRAERERRGLSVAQVAREIRVGSRYLEALEAGRYQSLPPPLYVKGFIEAYAVYLGLDPEAAGRLFEEAEAERVVPGDERRGLVRMPVRESFNWRDWTIPITLAAGLMVLLLARIFLAPAPPELPDLSLIATPKVAMVPAPVPGVETEHAGPGGELPPALTPGVRLLLRSEGATWVAAATDGDEERRYDLQPGQNLELAARERIRVHIGDAGLLRIRFNARELGFIGMKGETKRGLLFAASKPRETAGKNPPSATDARQVRETPESD